MYQTQASERALIDQFLAALRSLPVLIAESISPGAKELLRAERVGYYDSGGSLYLPARGAYLYVDRPPPKSLSRSMRTLFTGRRAQVLHGLLVRHDKSCPPPSMVIWAASCKLAPATASGSSAIGTITSAPLLNPRMSRVDSMRTATALGWI